METDLNINPDSSDSISDLSIALELDNNANTCKKRKITYYSEKEETFKETNANNKTNMKNKTDELLFGIFGKQNQNYDLSCNSVISSNNEIEKEQNGENSNNSDIQISATDMAKINAPHSLIWFFFTKMENNQYKAVCNICKIVRNIPTGTTTTLQNHLKRHVVAYNEYSKLKELKDITKSKNKIKEKSNRHMSLKNSFESKAFLDSSNKKAQKITKAIAMFICKGLHAYSIVEEPAFKDLLFLLEPRYVVPCRTTFSRSVVPKLYEKLKERMLNIIKSAKATLYSVCITTDLWTSRSGDSYIAFTLQFLDEDFVMQHMTVDCQPFPGKHDSIAICDKVENVICELDLLDEKIKKYIVSDNGANMVKALSKNSLCNAENDDMAEAVNRKSWEHILCYNHTLQLTISDTRKEMNANNVIEKVSNIVARYNRSKSARESLEYFQAKHKIPKHDLIQMVCTRWDSEFLMLERFMEQKSAIISEQNKAGIDGLTVQEWKLIEGYVEVLRPIANFTAEMGSRSKPTLSMVLPVIFEIKSSLEDIIKKAPKGTGILFARKLLANIKLRFTDLNYWESLLYRVAMLLDPRFKNTLLNNKETSLLEDKAIEKLKENTKNATCQTTIQTQSLSTKSSMNKSKWGHLKKKTDIRNMNAPNEEAKIKIEVENYLKSPTIEEQENPLTWWRSNVLTFPSLAPLARHYLAIAATETLSERVFSVGGNVVTNKRTNLLAENVRQTIFCHDNLVALDSVRFEKC